MSDIFSLFDGKMGAGSAAAVEAQTADSFSDVSSENDLITRLASGSDMSALVVDYSDFANFVTFNSAESYVNVTADQVLNDYPFGGTVDDYQQFLDSLDGYQRYFLGLWPSRIGYLRLNPEVSSSYVRIDDFGVQDGVAKTSFISPGTGSMSIQGWIDVPEMTGSNDIIVVFQKTRGSAAGADLEGLFVYVTGSTLTFSTMSGTFATPVSVSATLGEMPMFFSAVVNRGSSTSSLELYTATTGTFPVLAQSTSTVYGARFDLASGSFYFCHAPSTAVISGKTIRPFTGSIDDISIWSSVRGLTALTSSFNRKVYAQSGLIGAWRFNEATPETPATFASIVRDCSGHRLDGRIQSYFSGSRASGSFAYDLPDPILSLDDPNVIDYVVNAQTSGSNYDRQNGSLIFNLFPDAFSKDSETFQNFTLIMARFFDRVKLYIKQLPNLRIVDHSYYDHAPDDLLEDVGAMFGWQFGANFATTDALKYFVGRDVATGPSANNTIDTRMSDIKSRFWRRLLQNIMYIYKTKGTRESVEALLRVYGVNDNFVRLKEYARKSEARLPVNRVLAEKSVYALAFGSASFYSAMDSRDPSLPYSVPTVGGTGSFSVEVRVRFPGPTNDDIPPTKTSGSIVTLAYNTAVGNPLSLWYEKPATTDLTGNLYITSSAGQLMLASASIFDDNFYNIAIVRETQTGSLKLSVIRYEADDLKFSSSSILFTGSVGMPNSQTYNFLKVGAWAGASSGEFWAQEVKMWDAALNSSELDDHARNYESYGRETTHKNSDLKMHWRLDQASQSEADETAYTQDSTLNGFHGTGSFFGVSRFPYKKFLNDYAYIPSIDYGWNQEKVRTYDGSRVAVQDRYEDERFASLEFNMYDALNEDISHLMASYDELNNTLGHPMNRYRYEYEGLQQMRETYFKRLQGQLNFKVFVEMLDFFDSSFTTIVQRLIPARTIFKGDEIIVESHMLERPKYQYGFRPIVEGIIEISGSISMIDRNEDWP
jgi:hypothetical protein